MNFTQFYSWQLQNLESTGYYYNELVDSIWPTANFLYDNLLTNPIFYGIVVTVLVVSVFSFSD